MGISYCVASYAGARDSAWLVEEVPLTRQEGLEAHSYSYGTKRYPEGSLRG